MNTGRLNPLTDDHGDQFPGALPVPETARTAESDERFVRMQADPVRAAAHEPAESYADEDAGARRPAGRRTPTRGQDGRRPADGARLRHLARRSLRRFDQYTLDVFNPAAPYRRSSH